ncbi:MAG: ComF family protein [Betaproteobacteria bacterium]
MPRILPERWQIAATALLDACLPPSCLLCGADSQCALCAACAADLPLLAPGCPQCAEPTTHGERCGRCLTHPPHFDATIAAFRYAFPVDRLMHAFKYAGELALAGWFSRKLVEHIEDRAFHTILPMPLHPHRLQERGFNQAAELARHIGKSLKVSVDIAACHRRRPTTSQADLPFNKRSANVRGAFECSADLGGLDILLIDDVMTTGATLDECARTLKLHGAKSVTVAVVARALRD